MRVITPVLGPASNLWVDPMDAILTDRTELDYFDKPPVIIAASSDVAFGRAMRTIEAAGLRVGDTVGIESAGERIDRQVAATAIWVELDSDCGGPLDDLLTQVSRDVAGGRYAAVVSATADLLD